MKQREDLPASAPIGFILADDEEGCYWMRGQGDWYFLNKRNHACSCPYYYHRGHLDNPCKHLKLLTVWLEFQKEWVDV